MDTRTLVGASSPPSSRSSVVLPEPFGPGRPSTAPFGTSRVTPLNTSGERGTYANDRSVALTMIHRHVERPAAGDLREAQRTKRQRRAEERRVRDDGVVLAPFATQID